MIIGVIIPHHIPYNLQGNMHLICAYIGLVGIVSITYINIYNSIRFRKLLSIYSFCLFCALLVFLKVNMVNSLSEIIVMLSTLFINNFLYKKRLLVK